MFLRDLVRVLFTQSISVCPVSTETFFRVSYKFVPIYWRMVPVIQSEKR